MAPLRAVRARWPGDRAVSLGAKLVLLLTGVGLLGALAITVLLVAIITPSFDRLEQRAVEAHIHRTRAALNELAGKVEGAVRDYGDWNASYDYMAKPNRAFEEESFAPNALANLGVNGMAYVRPDGSVVIARWLDLRRGIDRPEMRDALIAALRGIPLARALDGRSSKGFYARVGGDLTAMGVALVRRSDGTGEPRGFVVMARRISSGQLSAILQLDAHFAFTKVPTTATVTPERALMRIAVPLPGAERRPIAAAMFATPRDVSQLGRGMLGLAAAGSTLLLLLVLVVLRRQIDRLVLRPLGRVEAHMQRVRASGSLVPLEEPAQDDEIGSLVDSFNGMLAEQKTLRGQLEQQSFQLGRSESAVAVMHNVRNALNPVSTVLSQGLAAKPPVDRATLDRAIAELARDDLPAGRRQKLAAFAAAAVQAVVDDRVERHRQLTVGREAMRHVMEIIGRQQEEAHGRRALDPVDLTEVIRQNAALATHGGERPIRFEFDEAPCTVLANRVILSQVIGNLIGNAAEAIGAAGQAHGRITVALRDAGDRIEAVIRDNGEGFGPGVAEQLFQRGFSTRAHKSGGLGLHWCANAMNAMEGGLRLESDGPGTGASAVLSLRRGPAEMVGEGRLAA